MGSVASSAERRGDADELPALRIDGDDEAQVPHRARVPTVQLPIVQTPLQRADAPWGGKTQMLSEHRNKHAARRFLRRLVEVAGRRPLRATTDQHPAYRRAIRLIVGRKALHRTTQYLNNYTEQSHRAVKQRYYPMLGFGRFESASRFCTAFDEVRQYFRVRRRGEGHVSLAEQRRLFLARWRSLISELAAA